MKTSLKKTGISTIDEQVLVDAGLAPKHTPVKILGDGELTQKIDIKAHAFSQKAKDAIEALKGTAVKI